MQSKIQCTLPRRGYELCLLHESYLFLFTVTNNASPYPWCFGMSSFNHEHCISGFVSGAKVPTCKDSLKIVLSFLCLPYHYFCMLYRYINKIPEAPIPKMHSLHTKDTDISESSADLSSALENSLVMGASKCEEGNIKIRTLQSLQNLAVQHYINTTWKSNRFHKRLLRCVTSIAEAGWSGYTDCS